MSESVSVEQGDRARLTGMRWRVVGIAVVSAVVWLSQWLWYEKDIFPQARDSHVYRSGEALICVALVLLAVSARSLRVLEWGALLLLSALTLVHGYALLTVADACFVPFVLTLEWSVIVIALAAALTYRPTLLLFSLTWLVGALATRWRPGFDADLFDHVVLAVIYATVVVSVRNYDQSRRAAQTAQRELELANQALLRADEARTRLFTHLSHDFRTPLALIDGETRALRPTPGDGEAAGALERIRLSAASMTDLIDQLLQVAQLDATRQQPQLQNFDLGELVRRAAAPFDGGPRTGRIHVRIDAGGALLARADPRHAQRILHNLLANAARQLDAGASEVEVRVLESEAQLVITVENDGPTISNERRERIFERFASFDAAGGVASGLGLPLARELAELNGGSLTLEPDPVRTVFRVTLPRATGAESSPLPTTQPARAGSAQVESAPTATPLATRRDLLLVEDNVELARLVENALSHAFTLRRAQSLRQALDAVAERKPDVLLVDLMLPDGSGLELLDGVPRLVPGLPPPIVCLSALADEGARVTALSRGAQDFLLKPFQAQELEARLLGVCRRVEQREAELAAQRQTLLAELHDGVNAALARAALMLQAAENEQRPDLVSRARATVMSALEQARTLSMLEVRGVVPLPVALSELEGELGSVLTGFGLAPGFEASTDGSLNALSGVEHHTLGRLVIEAATNAVKHGRPTRVDCRIGIEDGSVELLVTSDGACSAEEGGAELSTGRGLRLALSRVQRLGGEVESRRSGSHEWTLRAVFPGSLSLRRNSRVGLRSSAAAPSAA